jgi:hypothetical protein
MMNWQVLDALLDSTPRLADSGSSGGDPRPLLDPRIAREPAVLSIAQCAVSVSEEYGRTSERVAVSFDACRNRSARSGAPDHHRSHQEPPRLFLIACGGLALWL